MAITNVIFNFTLFLQHSFIADFFPRIRVYIRFFELNIDVCVSRPVVGLLKTRKVCHVEGKNTPEENNCRKN